MSALTPPASLAERTVGGARRTFVQRLRGSLSADPALALLFLLAVAALGIGIWLRAMLLGAGSLWLDELWTMDAVSRSFKEMVGARLVSDSKPPLWSILAWIWLRLVGSYDAASLRVLPFGFGVAAVAVPILGALRLRRLGPALLVVSVLTAFSMFTLQYSVEFRAYSMMIAFGTVATVVWAGLIVGEVAPSHRSVFVFALPGALCGFSHYYGNLLYAAELVTLVGSWMLRRDSRAGVRTALWGALSLVPLAVWLILTRRWFPTDAVAGPPSMDAARTFVAYAFGPLTNVVSGHGPGYPYPDDAMNVEVGIVAVVGAALAMVFVVRRQQRREEGPTTILGLMALLAVIAGIGVAWIASLVLPPSMNYRNLGGLLPLLFLATACAATQFTDGRRNSTVALATSLVWTVGAVVTFVGWGLPGITPPWQAQAGYRQVSQVLLASAESVPKTSMIGIELPWEWHGEWDAAIRAEQRATPTESRDSPVPITWILTLGQISSAAPHGPLVIFADTSDQRSAEVFTWFDEHRRCERSTAGGPAFGSVTLMRCAALP